MSRCDSEFMYLGDLMLPSPADLCVTCRFLLLCEGDCILRGVATINQSFPSFSITHQLIFVRVCLTYSKARSSPITGILKHACSLWRPRIFVNFTPSSLSLHSPLNKAFS